MAKYAEKYIHKGDKIFVEGRIRNRSYDDKKGVRRVITEIYAENLEWLAAPRKVVDEVVKTNAPADGSYVDEDKSKLPF